MILAKKKYFNKIYRICRHYDFYIIFAPVILKYLSRKVEGMAL